jgi:hypothetical protein
MSTELIVFKEFEANLAGLEESNASMEFENTPDGIAERRAWYKTLRKGTNALDKLRKETGADYLRLKREVDAEAKGIQVRLDAMEIPHKIVLDEIKAAEDKEIADLAEKNRLAAEIEVDERMAYLENGERKLKAAEDKIAEEAAALKATADRIERETKAAAITASAVKEAVKESVQVTITSETAKTHEANGIRIAKELEEKNKQDELDEKERLRVADVEHQNKIQGEIYRKLRLYVDPNTTQSILDAIVAGEIPHIEIIY